MGFLDKLISIQTKPGQLLSADLKGENDTFLGVWSGDYTSEVETKVSIVQADFFTEDVGYDESDIVDIKKLGTGEVKILDNNHWVVRIK